jgi:hypothetical protein
VSLRLLAIVRRLPEGRDRDRREFAVLEATRPEGHRRSGHGYLPQRNQDSDKDMKTFEARHLRRQDFHGDWNYTIPAIPRDNTTHANRGK